MLRKRPCVADQSGHSKKQIPHLTSKKMTSKHIIDFDHTVRTCVCLSVMQRTHHTRTRSLPCCTSTYVLVVLVTDTSTRLPGIAKHNGLRMCVLYYDTLISMR